MCRNGVKKAKAHLQLNLGRDRKGNMRDFYRSISSNREIRENEGLTLNGARDLVTKDTEKDEVSNTFFTSVFTDKICPEELQAPESSGKVWSNEVLPSVRRIALGNIKPSGHTQICGTQ